MNRKTETLPLRRSPRKPADAESGPAKSEKNVIEGLLDGAQRLTVTVFYIGCGATVLVWETVEHWSRTLYAGMRPFWKPKGGEKAPAAPRKKKVHLFPIDHYDRLTVDQIVQRLADLTESELREVRAYETNHRNRSGVLNALDRRLAEER